jgi:hypothetical protein
MTSDAKPAPKSKRSPKAPRPPRPPKLGGYFNRVNLLTSLVLIFPLFVIYQIGVLAMPQVHNGADLVTSELLKLLHGNLAGYIGINLGLGIALVIALAVMRKRNDFRPRLFLPVIAESAIYALSMGSLIVFVMTDLLHVDPRLAIGGGAGIALAAPAGALPHVGVIGNIILACGAGVHEELVFRLLMIPLLYWFFFKLLRRSRFLSMALAFIISAALFSAAHHIIGGEPWALGAFVYRFLCGLLFATLFEVRGFGVAVYTHALYDIFVLTLHP